MNLVLRRFSQDVDMSNPDEVGYFLVFATEQGTEIRLPVLKSTTETLVKFLYSQKKTEVEEVPEEVEEELENEEAEEYMAPEEAFEEDELESELDIPSL